MSFFFVSQNVVKVSTNQLSVANQIGIRAYEMKKGAPKDFSRNVIIEEKL